METSSHWIRGRTLYVIVKRLDDGNIELLHMDIDSEAKQQSVSVLQRTKIGKVTYIQ